MRTASLISTSRVSGIDSCVVASCRVASHACIQGVTAPPFISAFQCMASGLNILCCTTNQFQNCDGNDF